MIYLASPYSHPDPAIRQQRYEAVCIAAAALMRNGVYVFSPIAHSHGIAAHGLGLDWAAWAKYDRDMLGRCDALWVLILDGWDASTGIAGEIEIAAEFVKPVRYLTPALTFVSRPCGPLALQQLPHEEFERAPAWLAALREDRELPK